MPAPLDPLWIALLVAGPLVSAVVAFAVSWLTLRTKTLEIAKLTEELAKLQHERTQREAKIKRPTPKEIEKHGAFEKIRPLLFSPLFVVGVLLAIALSYAYTLMEQERRHATVLESHAKDIRVLREKLDTEMQAGDSLKERIANIENKLDRLGTSFEKPKTGK